MEGQAGEGEVIRLRSEHANPERNQTSPDCEDTEKLLTVAEVAKMLRVSEAWIRSHSNGGSNPQIPVVRMGACRRFRRATIEKFIADMERTA